MTVGPEVAGWLVVPGVLNMKKLLVARLLPLRRSIKARPRQDTTKLKRPGHRSQAARGSAARGKGWQLARATTTLWKRTSSRPRRWPTIGLDPHPPAPKDPPPDKNYDDDARYHTGCSEAKATRRDAKTALIWHSNFSRELFSDLPRNMILRKGEGRLWGGRAKFGMGFLCFVMRSVLLVPVNFGSLVSRKMVF